MNTDTIAEERRAKYAELLAAPKVADIAHTPETIREEFLSRHKRNPNTFAAYKRALNDFAGFFAEFGIDLFDVDIAKLRVYLDRLIDEGAGAQKINQQFAAIRGFYKVAIEYSESTGILRDPCIGITLPSLARVTASKGLSVEHADRLRRAANNFRSDEEALRATAVVELLLTTGIRVEELVAADVKGFDRSDTRATLDIVRKGGAADRVTLPMGTAEALQDVLDGRKTGPLILSATGRRMTRGGVARLLLAVGDDGGLSDFRDRLYPHNFRVAFASFAHAAGIAPLLIMRMMGHAKIDTTNRYIVLAENIDPQDARRVLRLPAQRRRHAA